MFYSDMKRTVLYPHVHMTLWGKHKHASQQSRISKTVEISIIPECHSLLCHAKEETGKENGAMYFSIKSSFLSESGCWSAH